MAGISSLSAAASGLPQFCDSSAANSMRLGLDAIRELQQQRAAILRHRGGPAGKCLRCGASPRPRSVPRKPRATCAMTLPVAGSSTLVLFALAFDQLAVNEQFRVHRRAS